MLHSNGSNGCGTCKKTHTLFIVWSNFDEVGWPLNGLPFIVDYIKFVYHIVTPTEWAN